MPGLEPAPAFKVQHSPSVELYCPLSNQKNKGDKYAKDGHFFSRRSRRRTYLAASGGHKVFLRRPFGAGAEARLGNPGRAETRSVRGESRGNCLEVEAELVHRRQTRPNHSARSGALLRQAHGRNHL